jgi:hypothetical protein
MKKLLSALLLLTLVFSLSACGEDEVELGEYKPGLHLGYSDGNRNSFAYVYVDAEGFIEDIHIDAVYAKRDSEGPMWDLEDDTVNYLGLTKRTLDDGCDYGMHEDADDDCEADEEGKLLWVAQVDAIADDVVENQGIPEYSITDGKFDDDAITGVSITVTSYYTAIENALELAELGSDEKPTDFDVPEFDSEGDYTPGIQYGYSEGHQNGHAFIAVNEEGNIVHAAVDVVYFKSTATEDAVYGMMNHGSEATGIITTKMSLDYGTGYGMHRDDDGNVVDGEMPWEEQMQALADAVVENQGLEDYSLVDGAFENPDDAVAGVSITVDHVIEAFEMALGR